MRNASLRAVSRALGRKLYELVRIVNEVKAATREKRANATHESKTDPDEALSQRQQRAGEALLHRAHADREPARPALAMIDHHDPASERRLTIGADKGYDTGDFVADLRGTFMTPHVAQKV